MTSIGDCRYDITLAPSSGKAVPVYQGETLRITQAGGEQCVDFNCFNLHDYKERMSVGHMRLQGFRVRRGHIAVSAPPRYNPMLAITHMAETCVTDLLGSRCDATGGEREYGLVPRTNCQDTFAEAIREYGLTPDDVHDSFNMWMHTVWGESFRILGFLEGSAELRWKVGRSPAALRASRGETILLPAAMPCCDVIPLTAVRLLCVYLVPEYRLGEYPSPPARP